MKLTRLRCPNCGADFTDIDINENQHIFHCTRIGCGASFIIDQGIRFADIQEAEAVKIQKYRSEMMDALIPLNRVIAKKNAESILSILPNDFRAKAVLSITESSFEDKRPLEEFVSAKYECTPQEFTEVYQAILENSNYKTWKILTENISSYITDPETIALLQERAEIRLRTIEKQNDYYAMVDRDIFICHSSVDNSIVLRVVEALESDGYKCWISERNMPPDTLYYWDKISQAIKCCRIFLSCCSYNAMLSDPVQKELAIAGNTSARRLELKMDDAKHTTLFAHFFEGLTWVKLTENFDESMISLKEAIYRVLNEKEEKRSDEDSQELTLQDLFNAVNACETSRQYEEGLKLLLENEQRFSESADLLLKIGKFYRYQSDYDKAYRYYQKAEAIDPEHPGIYINTGSFYNTLGINSKAKDEYEKAIALLNKKPGSVSFYDQAVLYANYAWCLGKLGEKNTAHQYLQEAEKLGYPAATIKKIEAEIDKNNQDDKDREEAERLRKEAEAQKQREEAERLRKETEAQKQREEAERLRKEAEAQKQREEAERLRKEAEAQKQREEAERLRKEAEARKQREEAERLRKEAEKRRQQEEAERLRNELEEKQAANYQMVIMTILAVLIYGGKILRQQNPDTYMFLTQAMYLAITIIDLNFLLRRCTPSHTKAVWLLFVPLLADLFSAELSQFLQFDWHIVLYMEGIALIVVLIIGLASGSRNGRQ